MLTKSEREFALEQVLKEFDKAVEDGRLIRSIVRVRAVCTMTPSEIITTGWGDWGSQFRGCTLGIMANTLGYDGSWSTEPVIEWLRRKFADPHCSDIVPGPSRERALALHQIWTVNDGDDFEFFGNRIDLLRDLIRKAIV